MAPRETFKNLREKIEGTIKETLGSDFSQKLQAQLNDKLQEKFGDRWTQSAQKISQATHLATETAKFGFQQALSQLEQKGFDVHDPKAFAQSVGKKALEEAERLRKVVAENPLSPAWLRDITFTPDKRATPASEEGEIQEMNETSPVEATATGSIVESVMSEAAEGMQPGHGALDEELTEEGHGAAEDEPTPRMDEEGAPPKKRKSSRSSKGSGSRLSH